MLFFSCVAMKLAYGSPSSCLIPREMRSFSTSMPRTTASTSSPFLKLRIASSPVADQERSDRWTRPSMPPGRPMKMPKSVIDLMAPFTLSPFLWFIANSSHGFAWHCFIPREMRRRSSSISRIMTSTSSPSETTLDGWTFLLVQSISETCTRPSIPCSTSTNAP
ncbi:hypothetical protein SDC9_149759 [bioreactor metagenome]|uniref:Uncharacterized protein n=1 Tax=bioreactor metagenome TaxID=1076179 RepID=A0A645EPT2_9ZZZZ